MRSNLGMYRIQMAGNDYVQDREVGLHYQIKRDIGIHHTNAIARNEPLRVSVFVGGPQPYLGRYYAFTRNLAGGGFCRSASRTAFPLLL